MSLSIPLEQFTATLFETLDETFEQVQGIYLDRGTSLFETLAGITAETASKPVSSTCATLAAQVEHVRFYLDVLNDVLMGKDVKNVDWGEIWRTVSLVTAEEWLASQARLRESYQTVRRTLANEETWKNDDAVSGALAILVHTAYHLGEIRQALCTLL
jgi:hypothetical protein